MWELAWCLPRSTLHTHSYVHTYTHMHAHKHAFVRIHTHVYTHTCMHSHTHLYTCTHKTEVTYFCWSSTLVWAGKNNGFNLNQQNAFCCGLSMPVLTCSPWSHVWFLPVLTFPSLYFWSCAFLFVSVLLIKVQYSVPKLSTLVFCAVFMWFIKSCSLALMEEVHDDLS